VIFVMLGTHQQPFPRLIDALAALPADDLVVQYGHSSPPAHAREAAAFFSFGEIMTRLGEADAVVTHAGVGSILLARRMGHTPVVVPRQRRHGEHVDDHQMELTSALSDRGAVIPLWQIGDLWAAVAGAPPPAAPRPRVTSPLHEAVRRALDG